MSRRSQPVQIPTNALVVLVGPSSAGKSTWATSVFRPEQIVSSDDLRAVVGESRYDLGASDDAFDVLDRIVRARVGRGLLTVVDTLGLDQDRRRALVALGTAASMVPVAIVVETPGPEIRARNRRRAASLPAGVLTAQIRLATELEDKTLASDGFPVIHRISGHGSGRTPTTSTSTSPSPSPAAATVVSTGLTAVAADAASAADAPIAADAADAPAAISPTDATGAATGHGGLRFGLQIGRFDGDPAGHAERLVQVARAAEAAGFHSLWVMDHMVQIPQVGRRWEDTLESYTTLAYLAGATEHLRLGVLVTAITFRRLPHLAKILATLDVLSGGRAVCGLGAAWFRDDHTVLGTTLPPVGQRYDLLRDACEVLPLLWGPGTPAFTGRTLTVPEAICYPRPIQDPIPIMIGGSGERTTLRLVARYADACNLFGDPATVRSRVRTLHDHCAELGRDPGEIEISHLATVLTAPDQSTLDDRLAALTPARRSVQRTIERFDAAVLEVQMARFADFARAGVSHSILALPVTDADRVSELAPLVRAFASD